MTHAQVFLCEPDPDVVPLQWLTYWLIFSLVQLVEAVLWPVLKWCAHSVAKRKYMPPVHVGVQYLHSMQELRVSHCLDSLLNTCLCAGSEACTTS